jgi:hypothetical protein
MRKKTRSGRRHGVKNYSKAKALFAKLYPNLMADALFSGYAQLQGQDVFAVKLENGNYVYFRYEDDEHYELLNMEE